MKSQSQGKPRCLHRFFLLNMLMGILLVSGTLYFIITGEYVNLLERQATEAILNRVALGALLYAAAAWFADIYFSPRCRLPQTEL